METVFSFNNMRIPLYPTIVHTHRYSGGENKRQSTKYVYLSARILLFKKKKKKKRNKKKGYNMCMYLFSPLLLQSQVL